MEKFNHNTAQLKEFNNSIDKMIKDLTFRSKDLGKRAIQVMKQPIMIKEKKGKFNKQPCNMQLMSNGHINVIMDDLEQSQKLFE